MPEIEIYQLRGKKEEQCRTIDDLVFTTNLSRSLLSAENKPEVIGEVIAKEVYEYLRPHYVFVDIFDDEMGAEGERSEDSLKNVLELTDNGTNYGKLEIGLQSIEDAGITRKLNFVRNNLPFIIGRLRLYKEFIDIQELATIDSKTQLSNMRRVKRVLEQYHVDKLKYSIVFFDLDNFKELNRQFGEHRTDYILVQIAKLMKEDFKSPNIRARFGGDEFSVIFPSIGIDSIYDTFYKFVERIRNHEFQVHGYEGKVSLTTSVGGTDYLPERDDSSIKGWRDILDRAVDAEYFSKTNGKNRFSVYEESMKRGTKVF